MSSIVCRWDNETRGLLVSRTQQWSPQKIYKGKRQQYVSPLIREAAWEPKKPYSIAANEEKEEEASISCAQTVPPPPLAKQENRRVPQVNRTVNPLRDFSHPVPLPVAVRTREMRPSLGALAVCRIIRSRFNRTELGGGKTGREVGKKEKFKFTDHMNRQKEKRELRGIALMIQLDGNLSVFSRLGAPDA